MEGQGVEGVADGCAVADGVCVVMGAGRGVAAGGAAGEPVRAGCGGSEGVRVGGSPGIGVSCFPQAMRKALAAIAIICAAVQRINCLRVNPFILPHYSVSGGFGQLKAAVAVGDGKAAVFTEGTGGYLDSGGCLSPLVFIRVNHLNDLFHHFSAEALG